MAGVGSYLKNAFLFRWNLLAFIGGVAAAALSPWPDAFLPLIAAVELAFLMGMVSIPRFRQAIDAKEHAARTGQPTAKGRRVAPPSVTTLLKGIPLEARSRFEKLKRRCLEMRRIAHGVRGQTGPEPRADELRMPSLDRLLWVFLRLLVAQAAMARFLDSTDETELNSKLEQLRNRLEDVKESTDERIKASLHDSVAVAQLRLDNYQKADKNAQFVDLELDRIETKIQALVEMSVNRQDPDFLTSQVDAVAESMRHTETAISELQTITGLADVFEEPPPILEADLRGVVES